MDRRLHGMLVLGIFLRVSFYTSELWNDEVITKRFVEGYTPVEILIQVPTNQPHFPTYYLMLKAWPWATDTAKIASLLAACLLVYLVLVYVNEWYGRDTAMYTGWFVATSPFLVIQASWLRMYSILALVFFIAYVHWHEGNDTYCALSLCVLAVLHPYGILVSSGFVFRWIRERYIRHALAVVTASVPGVGVMLHKILDGPSASSLGHIVTPPSVLEIMLLPGSLFTGRIFSAQVLGLAAFLSLWCLWFLRDMDLDTRVIVTMPIVAVIGLSYGVTPIFQAKYLAVFTPLFALAIGRGFARIDATARFERDVLFVLVATGQALCYATIQYNPLWFARRVLQ